MSIIPFNEYHSPTHLLSLTITHLLFSHSLINLLFCPLAKVVETENTCIDNTAVLQYSCVGDEHAFCVIRGASFIEYHVPKSGRKTSIIINRSQNGVRK